MNDPPTCTRIGTKKKARSPCGFAGESNSRRVGGDKCIVPVYNTAVFFRMRMTDIPDSYNSAKGKNPQHKVLWAFTCLLPSSLGLDFLYCTEIVHEGARKVISQRNKVIFLRCFTTSDQL
jgi:hypothetical protein